MADIAYVRGAASVVVRQLADWFAEKTQIFRKISRKVSILDKFLKQRFIVLQRYRCAGAFSYAGRQSADGGKHLLFQIVAAKGAHRAFHLRQGGDDVGRSAASGNDIGTECLLAKTQPQSLQPLIKKHQRIQGVDAALVAAGYVSLAAVKAHA